MFGTSERKLGYFAGVNDRGNPQKKTEHMRPPVSQDEVPTPKKSGPLVGALRLAPRIVHDGTVLQVSKFPDPSLLGALVTCPEDADAVLSALCPR